MYEEFFQLRELPFSASTDPKFLWLSETHLEALSTLEYGITSKGLVLLTGAVGAGKTTLLRAVLDRVPQGTAVAVVGNTAGLEPIDLLKLIAHEFRLPGPFETKADYLIAIEYCLLDRMDAGLRTVLIVDEAQNLDHRGLETLRLLSNLESGFEKLLQIVLTGQPELRERLQEPAALPLRQRITLEYHVEPLRLAEIGPYLDHRITVAGGERERVFLPGVERHFFDMSKGCPRLVNLLGDSSLLSGFALQVRPVPPELVEQRAKELRPQLDPFAKFDGED